MSEKRILVVDDEKQIRDLYSQSFARAGFEDYFIKPASLSDLLEAAEQAFKKLARWKKR